MLKFALTTCNQPPIPLTHRLPSPDLPHFLASAEQCDYDRQAARYLDALSADRFLIIGVQKKVPHEVWLFDDIVMPGSIAQGCKKYAELFTPSRFELNEQS